MSSFPSVEQQQVTSNDGKPTYSEDGRTVHIKTQVHPNHRQEIDQVLSHYPLDCSKAEEMIGKPCEAQTLLSKAKTKNLIIDKDNNYLKIAASGTTTVPAKFILEGNSSRQEVLQLKKLPAVAIKFVDDLHKSLRVLAVETKVEFNGQCDIKKYGKDFNEETMRQQIQEDKTPDAQLATLHCLYQHIRTLNDLDGRQIEDRILLQIIVAMKNLKSDIVRSTQKWLRTLVLKYFMFVQRYYSFGKLKKGDSYSTVNTYERLLVLSKEDLYGCYMVVACINHVKSVLNLQSDVKEQLFRKYTMCDRGLQATEDNVFLQTFWEECYKDAMKKLIKTPQEIHLKKHEQKMQSEQLKKQSTGIPKSQLNSKTPALELGLAQLKEELARRGGTYEEACKRGRENYTAQRGGAVTDERCFEAGAVAGDKFTHYHQAYVRKQLTQTEEMTNPEEVVTNPTAAAAQAEEVVAPSQEEVSTYRTTAAAQAKENNNEGDDSNVDPKAIDNGKKRTTPQKQQSPPSSSSTPAKKKTKAADASPDLSYCAEDQQNIDDSIDEVMTKERCTRSNPREYHESVYSQSYSMKRVCNKKKKDPSKKGFWGTVIHGYYKKNSNDCCWTIHFDDNTVASWNSEEMDEGLVLYERNKTIDPSGNHKKKSNSSTAKSSDAPVSFAAGVSGDSSSDSSATSPPSSLKMTNCVVQNNPRSSNEPKEKMATVGSDKFCKRRHNIDAEERECAYDDMKPLEQKHYYKKFQVDYSTCSIGGVKCLLKNSSTKFKSDSDCQSLKQNFGQYLQDTGTHHKHLFLLLVKRFETTTGAGSNRIFGEVDDSKLHTKLKYCQLCIHPGLNDQEPRANPSAACMSCIVDLEERRNEKERGVVTDSSAKKRKRMPLRKPRTQNK